MSSSFRFHFMHKTPARLQPPDHRQTAWGLPKRISHALADLFYPPRCVFCHADLPSDRPQTALLCTDCLETLVPEEFQGCRRCGNWHETPNGPSERCFRCTGRRFAFSAVVPLGVYEDSLRTAILMMKHPANRNLAHALGNVYSRNRISLLESYSPDLVVPIPMHWWPRLRRGVNQPDLTAQQIAHTLKIPWERHLLKKIRHTPPQKNLNWQQRRQNVRGAFQLQRGYEVSGATIVLVDDVVTSGATCHEAAKVLRRAGARQVIVATIARTPVESRI